MIDEKKLKESIKEYFKNFVSEGNRFFDAITANADIKKLIDAMAADTQEEIEKCSNCSRRKFYQEGYVDGLNANKWIPCSEKLPNCNGVYIVTRETSGGRYYSSCAYFDGQDTWHDDNRLNHGRFYVDNIVAWQPLPEPYKELEND